MSSEDQTEDDEAKKEENQTDFDIAFKRIDVTIGGVAHYIQELDADQMKHHRLKLIRMQNKDGTSNETSVDMPFHLLKTCLIVTETNKPIDEKVLRTWPTRVTDALFLKAMRLSRLLTTKSEVQQEEEDAKN